MLLALDTSTRIMSLALHSGDTVIFEQTLTVGRNHSEMLAPMIRQTMEQCDVNLPDLTAMAVAVGPGSYTGLRIGVSLAKGMAAVHQLPLVGVSTLEILALGQPFYNTRYTLIAVVPAGRGRIIAESYRGKKGRWVSNEDAEIQTWDDLLETVDDQVYVTGEITSDGLAKIADAQSKDLPITLIPPAYRLRRAGFLAEEAWRRIREAEDETEYSPDKVMPIYLKSPDAN